MKGMQTTPGRYQAMLTMIEIIHLTKSNSNWRTVCLLNDTSLHSNAAAEEVWQTKGRTVEFPRMQIKLKTCNFIIKFLAFSNQHCFGIEE